MLSPIVNRALKLLRSLDTDRIIVAYSGGKDSLATIDLCCKAFGPTNVFAYYLWMIPDADTDRPRLKLLADRYGIIPAQFPHPGLIQSITSSTLRTPTPSLKSALPRKWTYQMTEKAARLKAAQYFGSKAAANSPDWIAAGHRVCDSLQRAGMIRKHKGCWLNTEKGQPVHRCYPIWDWKPTEVVAYLESRKLPVPEMYGTAVMNTSGLSVTDSDVLAWLRDNSPRDYAKVLTMFPDADMTIARDAVRKTHGVSHKQPKPHA